jgi:hypothetical protein
MLIQVNLVYFCFFYWFFYQFHPLITIYHSVLSQYALSSPSIFFFLFSFFFQFHSLILGCLGIEFRKFLFNLFSLKLFQSHVFSFFLRFQSSTIDLLEMEFYSFFFHFLFMNRSYDLSCGFNKLARVDLSCFF